MPAFAIQKPKLDRSINLGDAAPIRRQAASDVTEKLRSRACSSQKQSSFYTFQSRMEDAAELIAKLSMLEDDWDSFGTPRPSDDAISSSLMLLSFLKETLLVPSRIAASAEGGVAMVLSGAGSRSVLIESLNTGETYLYLFDTVSFGRTIMLSNDVRQIGDAFRNGARYLQKGETNW